MSLTRLKQKHDEIVNNNIARENFTATVSIFSFVGTVFFTAVLEPGLFISGTAVLVVPLFVYYSVKKSLGR